MLKLIDKSKLKEERKVQHKLDDLINKNKSLLFEAGAGSGKTYALVQSVKNLLRNKRHILEKHNQKIAVITFTNVATDEIMQRVGTSPVLEVSTIHERLWSIIKRYQKQLVDIHLRKLKREIQKEEDKIQKEDRFTNLSKDDKDKFIAVMLDNKKNFYDFYDLRAKDAKEEYGKLLSVNSIDSKELLRNIQRFKSLVGSIYRFYDYKNAIKLIKQRDRDYKEVLYNHSKGIDRLAQMEISHDTLLEYAHDMVIRNPLLQRIIIDEYPYIFVDEYQDTNPLVVKLLNKLEQYAIENNRDFFVGYYGDKMQHIYDYGVGDKIHEYHKSLKLIIKKFNRRSTQEVINTINQIRDDGIKQESIYSDAVGGNVKFYFGEEEQVSDFIKKYKDKWEITEENPLNCLVLTNESIAKYIGISKLYNLFKKSPRYKKGQMFKRLNDELLGKNPDNLGEVQRILHNFFKLITDVETNGKTVSNILISDNMRRKITFIELQKLIASIKSVQGDTLGELLQSLELEYMQSNNIFFKELIDYIFNFPGRENFDLQQFKVYILQYLGEIEERIVEEEANLEEGDKAREILEELLSIEKEQFLNWYNYRMLNNQGPVRYHTYHGTKGDEFPNVIIIMESTLNRRDLFGTYFRYKSNPSKMSTDMQKLFNEARNLLYVATSRAIKNLRIFYINEIDELMKVGINDIFGKVNKF